MDKPAIEIERLLAIIAQLELAHGGGAVVAFANDLRRAIADEAR